MARCDNCGRPAGFGQHLCSLCAGGGGAAREAAATPHTLLTVPGTIRGGEHDEHFELRVTSHGLEAETVGGQPFPFGEPPEVWHVGYDQISRVDWEPGRTGWGITVWGGGQALYMVHGLDSDLAPAAEKLVARKLAERPGRPQG